MQLSSDMPHTSEIGMPRPTKKASVSFGIGAAPDTACLTCSSPSFSRSFESTSSSACAHSAATSSGTGSPATSASAFFAATARPHCKPIRFVSSGSFAAANSIAALSFSHTRGYRTPNRRPHVGQRCRDGPRIGDGGDLGAEHLLQIQRAHPVGDVGGRQERRAAVAEPDAKHLVDRERLEQQVGVRHLHALGIAGGARRVDQRGHVVGLHCPP